MLQARLVPRLRERIRDLGRPVALRILAPGPRPAATYGQLLTPAENEPESWVVVDQFEEIFTLCRDREELARFIDLLPARDPDSRVKVLIARRADFYARCAEHRNLADALRGPVIHLLDQQYWEIGGLELTNAASSPAYRSSVLAENSSGGVLHHIRVHDMNIHNITGWPGGWYSTGAGVGVQTDHTTPVSTWDDVVVENNTFDHVDRIAVAVTPDGDGQGTGLTTGTIIRGNTMAYDGADDILVVKNDGALIDGNKAGGSGANQNLTGLTPNTTYLLTGWAKVANAGETLANGVKNYGGTETFTTVARTSYSQAAVLFTTGSTNTSALVYCWKNTGGTGTGNCDDLAVERISTPSNVSPSRADSSTRLVSCCSSPPSPVSARPPGPARSTNIPISWSSTAAAPATVSDPPGGRMDEGGRGLQLVAAPAHRWGPLHARGKCIWTEQLLP